MFQKTHKKQNIHKKKNKFKKITLKNKQIENKQFENKQIETEKKNKNIKKYNIQDGGNNNIIKEKFEIRTLDDFDYDKYKLANYINTNIEWGNMPGIPPTPSCSIL